MEHENEYLTLVREAQKANKEDEDAYINKYKEFAQIVKSGNFKTQGEDEQND
jgi:hypothetical protein